MDFYLNMLSESPFACYDTNIKHLYVDFKVIAKKINSTPGRFYTGFFSWK
jgi:hypothetical protein